jgi:hypothetical protein
VAQLDIAVRILEHRHPVGWAGDIEVGEPYRLRRLRRTGRLGGGRLESTFDYPVPPVRTRLSQASFFIQ